MKYFYSSFLICAIGLFAAYCINAWEAVYICAILSVLEVSLSFDNAVVNAKVLNKMEKKWQDRFIMWGIPVAVFGMRFVFPIVIVCIAASLGIWETLHLAIYEPHEYYKALESARFEIYAFGGTFLFMVFLNFFFDDEKDVHWIGFLEDNVCVRVLKRFSNTPFILTVILCVILLYVTKGYTIGLSCLSALLLYLLIHLGDKVMNNADVAKSGIMGFLYLEILDASFSFDGVIGAFALSENIFIIMIGLGIGAMFVRSLTLYFVEKKTLQSFAYLEHGAHYAIGALAIIMFIKIFSEVSEIITGLIGMGFVSVAFAWSRFKK